MSYPRKKGRLLLLLALAAAAYAQNKPMQLIVVDPGHFHATLLQKEMYPELAQRVTVYAPLGPEVLDYLNRISLFNLRKENPTRWELDVHLTPDPMAEMLRSRHDGIAVFTGRNRGKIDRILAALSAGMNVLADKPWIIASADLPKLDQALKLAEQKHLAAYDIMTERYEVTSELQRELVNDPAVFGRLEAGTEAAPAITATSIHHLMKVVAGVPLRRPAWFFDIAEYGEGLADVGTHVVDLVQWTAFPDEIVDYRKDIHVLGGRRWPITLSRAQFAQVTGEQDFPPALAADVHDGQLDYFCNNEVRYTIRGVHVKLDIRWNWEAAAGAGDVYEAAFRGSMAAVEIRQGSAEKFTPEVYVVPANGMREKVASALHRRVAALQSRWPGLAVADAGSAFHIVIPSQFRVGHEAHFGQVATRFFQYVNSPPSLPKWENPAMLAKYYVSTTGTEAGR
jgi:predicted dehydrogenase